MTIKLDELIASARLSGRIDVLAELRDWLDAQMKAAEEANEKMKADSTGPEETK